MALSESAVSALLEVLRTGDAVDLIRESVRMVLQELIETEASDVIGAARYERTDSRVNERNGSRPRILATQAGDIDLRIPKLRKGSFFPLILEPRRRIDQALYAVVMEAYVAGVSTRAVDDLMAALGIDSGISKSEVLAHVPKTHTDMVAAVFRTIFAQPDTATVGATWNEVRDQLAGRFPKIGTLMDAAKADVLAFTAFPGRNGQRSSRSGSGQTGDPAPAPGHTATDRRRDAGACHPPSPPDPPGRARGKIGGVPAPPIFRAVQAPRRRGSGT
jgi:transposase-like protein